MIYDLVQTYLSVIVPVGIGSLIIFLSGVYWILSSSNTVSSQSLSLESVHDASLNVELADKLVPHIDAGPRDDRIIIPSTDITAISGHDEFSTQLDLARAYIETGSKQLAKKILDHVVLQGSDTQQQEAKELLSLCV